MTMITVIAAALLGAGLWTLTEYAMHRFGFHHRGDGRLLRLIATEHTRHHRDPARTNGGLRVVGHVTVALLGLPVGITIAASANVTFGITLWATWALGYTTYEIGHWRLHHVPPRSRTALHRRVRHMSHHGVNAATNFGVGLDWWDRVFSTTAPTGTVELAQAVAPQWLLDDPDSYHPLVLRDSQQTHS